MKLVQRLMREMKDEWPRISVMLSVNTLKSWIGRKFRIRHVAYKIEDLQIFRRFLFGINVCRVQRMY